MFLDWEQALQNSLSLLQGPVLLQLYFIYRWFLKPPLVHWGWGIHGSFYDGELAAPKHPQTIIPPPPSQLLGASFFLPGTLYLDLSGSEKSEKYYRCGFCPTELEMYLLFHFKNLEKIILQCNEFTHFLHSITNIMSLSKYQGTVNNIMEARD